MKEGVHALCLDGVPGEMEGTVVLATSSPGIASPLPPGWVAILLECRGFECECKEWHRRQQQWRSKMRIRRMGVEERVSILGFTLACGIHPRLEGGVFSEEDIPVVSIVILYYTGATTY